MSRKNNEGFTLLEMTIVILIVSVLFLLTVPSIQETLGIVNSKGCRALEKVGDAAILEYKMKYDEFPSSAGDLVSAGLLTDEQLKCDGSKTLSIINGQAHIE